MSRKRSAIPPRRRTTADASPFIGTVWQLATEAYQRGDLDKARQLYETVHKAAPKNPDALHVLGVIAATTKKPHIAIELFNRAIAVSPNNAAYYVDLGNVLQEVMRPDEAVASYDKAIAIEPDYVHAYSNRSNALAQLKRPDEALASCDKAIAIRADFADAYSNRGNVLTDLGRLDEAVASYDLAIALRPDHADAYANRGSGLQDLGRLDEAVASYDRAIALKPDHALAYCNKALIHLLRGNLSVGWIDYEWRWHIGKGGPAQRPFSQPLWRGDQPLQGKTILLHGEQGFGDSIQFCRYAPMVADLGADVILEVPKPLVGLMDGIPGITQIVAAGDALPEFDFQCPLMSLPLAFKTTLADIPYSTSYLFADSAKQSEWDDRLGRKNKPRVGLVWSGSTTHRKDQDRSVALETLLRYLPEGYQYVCLQKELREADRAVMEANSNFQFFGEELKDFTDTAALCKQLDLVISVDTSVVHLAGALGLETWVLLPHVPDWRWLLDRDDSPWYPSMKLYRQPTLGHWEGALKKMQADLEARLSDLSPANRHCHDI